MLDAGQIQTELYCCVCVLTGKSQEAYSALSVAESKVYEAVKSAVLKVYELVPEKYRQRFRSRKKFENQTYN